MTTRYMERLAKIEEVLLIANKKIDMNDLRAGCSYGVPESLRPLAWRLLLHYLPLERHKWQSFLADQRNNYDQMIEQIIVEPGNIAMEQSNSQTSDSDHPLSDHPTSDWQAFFQDNKVLSQIDKDVRRLYPEIQFFQLLSKFPHPHGMKYPLSRRVINHQELTSQEFGANRDGIVGCVKTNLAKGSHDENQAPNSEFHWHIVERILFIYAKLNPGVQYVQGMNELVAPIYYVFANDTDEEWAAYAEADTFFCFQQLMSEVKDNFIKTLDDSICGIESSMSAFHNMISTFDPELHKHLTSTLEIKPQFYAFRWLSLLLSQEFPLPDVITLWDALFSDPQRFALLPYVCLSMMVLQRESLISGDFPFCVRLLQNYPDSDVAKIVAYAQDIRDGKAPRPASKEVSKGSKIAKHARQLSDTLRNLSIIKK
ncbi:hypothetical protein L5515_018480 [Caenorhabditis briggsae]|nr:hypothetical protein L3Y34_012623 [Caenorhabditis briggsae]UMM42790.1 hypothetical protein L5515_018480 [Caenorhabditis briggsae]